MLKQKIVNKALTKLGQMKKAIDSKFETQIKEFGYGFKDQILESAKEDIIAKLHKENKSITSQNFSKKDFDFGNLETKISWHFEIEARSWGIKSFIISVPDQEITVHLKDATYALDEEDIQIHDVPVKIHLKNVKISNKEDINLNSTISPNELEFYQNKFEISF